MNKNDIWKILDDEFRENPTDIGGKVSKLEEIQDVEQKLGLKFDFFYIKFLQKYGSAILGGHFVNGLRKQRSMPDDIWSVIENTDFYKKKQNWPDIEDWYVISDDGRGNPIGVDPQGKIWLSDHDYGFEQVLLAEDFEEFLYKLYTDTLYE